MPSVRALPLVLALCAAPLGAQSNCANTSVGFTPLIDLGAGLYQGFEGGLYPGGVNERPIAHEVGGLAQVLHVVPRDTSGAPDPNGRVVVMSLGMSNCAQHWQAFVQASNADPLRDPRVLLVQGAQGGVAAEDMDDANDAYWTTVLPQKLQQAGVAASEVQVLWFLQANRAPTAAFPAHAQALSAQMAEILRIAKDHLPNVRIAYCAARIYAGYASTNLNPEPYAYEQGFAAKWLIEAQMSGDPTLNYDPTKGPVEAPWIAWGPYAWADGLTPRSDGLVWQCSDFAPDGTHPSAQGAQKNSALLLDFFRTDTSARTWYLAAPDPVVYGSGKPTSIGTIPRVSWGGAPVLGPMNFAVRLEHAVPNRPVIAFRGAEPNLAPFQGWTLWARQPLERLPVRVTDALGRVAYPIPVAPAMVGRTDHYSFWFRDPAHPDGTGSGVSDALAVRYR